MSATLLATIYACIALAVLIGMGLGFAAAVLLHQGGDRE